MLSSIVIHHGWSNYFSDVMVSMLSSIVIHHKFEHRSGLTKDHNLDISCISAKTAAFRIKSKYWSAQNQDNVSEWSLHADLFVS
jgi:hypothetical protein